MSSTKNKQNLYQRYGVYTSDDDNPVLVSGMEVTLSESIEMPSGSKMLINKITVTSHTKQSYAQIEEQLLDWVSSTFINADDVYVDDVYIHDMALVDHCIVHKYKTTVRLVNPN